MTTVVDVLLHARDLIVDGWVPRAPYRSNEVCALTAITSALLEAKGGRPTTVGNLLCEAVGLPRYKFEDLACWSDAGPKEKVITGFDAAIRLAKERENGE